MRLSTVCCLFCFIFAPTVWGFNFIPTEREFLVWDSRCKLAYSATQASQASGFYPNQTQAEKQQAHIFAEAAGGAWHYCAGLIYLQRAKFSSGQERDRNLNSALNEISFTARRIKLTNGWYPEIHIDLAKVYFEQGDKNKGFETLRNVLKLHPNNTLSYTALAYYLKQNKDIKGAFAVLKRAPDHLLAASAELNYFLGSYALELGQVNEAYDYAAQAYKLGYPIPALKNKLKQHGKTLP